MDRFKLPLCGMHIYPVEAVGYLKPSILIGVSS